MSFITRLESSPGGSQSFPGGSQTSPGGSQTSPSFSHCVANYEEEGLPLLNHIHTRNGYVEKVTPVIETMPSECCQSIGNLNLLPNGYKYRPTNPNSSCNMNLNDLPVKSGAVSSVAYQDHLCYPPFYGSPFFVGHPESVVDVNGSKYRYKTEFQLKKKRYIVRGAASRKTRRRKRERRFVFHSRARRNSILLAKKHGYKPHAVYSQIGVSDNLFSALFTAFFCCLPLGAASLYYTLKVREYRSSGNREMAQKSSLIGRKLANTGIMLGMSALACVFVYFLVKLKIPYVSVEYDYYLPEYNNR